MTDSGMWKWTYQIVTPTNADISNFTIMQFKFNGADCKQMTMPVRIFHFSLSI